ncbi:MAG: cupredoxin domain-containing protein [Gaiellaceae bacterium]
MRIALLLLLVGSMLAGCGSSESSEPVATTEVSMPKSYRFDPKTIEVDAGAEVTWRNEDNFTHTVEIEGQDDMKAKPGESVSFTFSTPGTYEYVCTLHSHDMHGTVIVR